MIAELTNYSNKLVNNGVFTWGDPNPRGDPRVWCNPLANLMAHFWYGSMESFPCFFVFFFLVEWHICAHALISCIYIYKYIYIY